MSTYEKWTVAVSILGIVVPNLVSYFKRKEK